MPDQAQKLRELTKTKDYFVGIDSDGCVFDSMGIKQKECFCPMLIGYFGLQGVSVAARQCKEFADLYSKTRGLNRHKTVVRILTELLPNHPDVIEAKFEVPAFAHYCKWVEENETELHTKGLEKAVANATNPGQKAELEQVLKWSYRVDEMIQEIVKNLPPFPYVRDSLIKMQDTVDRIVVSQTPCAALEREWAENDITQYVSLIAGQEMGTKSEHLTIAAKGNYDSDKILMIGDAPGDLKAARDNDALFFPIIPGSETQSWKRFYEEAFDKFLNGTYAGEYEAKLLQAFEDSLPENPPWS